MFLRIKGICTTPVLLISLAGENPRPRSDGIDDTTFGNHEYNISEYGCQPQKNFIRSGGIRPDPPQPPSQPES
jgi:hypothetical protein